MCKQYRPWIQSTMRSNPAFTYIHTHNSVQVANLKFAYHKFCKSIITNAYGIIFCYSYWKLRFLKYVDEVCAAKRAVRLLILYNKSYEWSTANLNLITCTHRRQNPFEEQGQYSSNCLNGVRHFVAQYVCISCYMLLTKLCVFNTIFYVFRIMKVKQWNENQCDQFFWEGC